tara:strand:+ start:202 stop:1134 length:933 start_codon:yes stop_codon:yes gene_type:complete
MMNTQLVSEKDFHTFNVFNYKSEYIKHQVLEDEDNILRSNYCNYGEYLFSFEMSNNTVEIESQTFIQQESLQKVIFSTSLKRIGDSAFEECLDLADVTIPPSVLSIGNLAFRDFSNTFNCNISTLEEVGRFVFGFPTEEPPEIKCGYITSIKEGNKFPNLNCYQRTCEMLLPLGNGNHIQLTLLYGIGKSIGEKPTHTINGNFNYEHLGFEGSPPEITFDRDIVQSSIIISNLGGDILTINGFFQQPEDEENFQALVNAQHPEMASVKWSIAPNWQKTPMKKLTCLEVIQQIIAGKFDVTEPILYLYDEE